MSKPLQFRFGVAYGFALLLASAPAVAAPFSFFGQPHYLNSVQSLPLKIHPKPNRKFSSPQKQAKREQQRSHGPFQIIVAVANQEVSLYGRDGFIARARISTGMAAHPTPTGVFSVISKARWHESNIYSRAPMPYMQRITWSGIALHAGPRPGYPASHGCIRLPEDFAVRLFRETKIGTRVIVTRAPTAPIEITHPKLFDPKKPTEQLATLGAEMVKGATGVADMPAGARPRVAAAAAPDGSTAAPIKPKPAVNLAKPISVFVSRKQRRVFVRRGFEQLFDLPIEIDHPDLPIGTHIFTAMQLKDDGKTMRWTAVSIPSKYPHHIGRSGKGHKGGQALDTEPVLATPSTAAEALDRITWPPDTIEQISSMLMLGSSLIVSDNALSDETGTDTDFIVLTASHSGIQWAPGPLL